MTLDQWLRRATLGLSTNSKAIVRAEIQEHYETARAEHGDPAAALLSLGDPVEVNCAYRQTLLTSEESRVLGEGNWEARMVCRHTAVKWLLLSIPTAALLASAALAYKGNGGPARTLFAAGLAMAVLLGGPFLPIYTPMRAIAYRAVKWIAIFAIIGFCSQTLGSSGWLLSVSLWPLLWSEWTRDAIRRKLPAKQWPKQLYL